MSVGKNLWQVFLAFFKIGAFTFGGGYAMIPLIQREAVEKQGWVTDEDILEIIAIAESTPGPIAINAATFIGYRVAGVIGSVAATLGVVLPSFMVILAIAGLLDRFRELEAVRWAFVGIRAGVLAQPVFWLSCGIFALMVVLAFKKTHPIVIICLSALIGIAAGYAGLL